MLIRYHLDEHIDPKVADGLRRRDIDVTTTLDATLRTASDDTHLAWAFCEGRVLVSRDADYLILDAQGVPHAGIVFWHSKRQSIGLLVNELTALHRTTSAEEMVGQVHFL